MTSTPRILIHNAETAALLQRLQDRMPDLEAVTCETYDDLPARLQDHAVDIVYSVRFAGTPGYPREALLGPNGPRWVSVGGAGTDHLGFWDPEKVSVTNASGVAAEMMAEYVIGGFLHFALDVPGLQADQAARRWRVRAMIPLKGKTLLIIGLGHTGQALAERAKAFGMRVMGTRARPVEMPYVDAVHAAGDLHKILPQADFIAVCVPLIPETRHLLDRAMLARVKSGAFFADVSRGGVVDQAALREALEDGRITGAALDVFETEPLPEASPLWGMKNVLISPHCSSVYAGWEMASFERFLDNVARFRSGQPLQNIVNPQRGY